MIPLLLSSVEGVHYLRHRADHGMSLPAPMLSFERIVWVINSAVDNNVAIHNSIF